MIGVGIGLMSDLIGASGGLIILLILVFLLEFPIHLAVGTSTLIMAITALSASIGYGLNGDLDIVVALVIAIGSITGGYFGSKFANRVSEDILSKIIGVVFIIIGIVMYLLPS